MSHDEREIGCEEAIRRLAQYLDGELGDRKSAEVERHLETCRSCWSQAEFERRLRERLADLRRERVSDEYERRIRTLIRRFGRAS